MKNDLFKNYLDMLNKNIISEDDDVIGNTSIKDVKVNKTVDCNKIFTNDIKKYIEDIKKTTTCKDLLAKLKKLEEDKSVYIKRPEQNTKSNANNIERILLHLGNINGLKVQKNNNGEIDIINNYFKISIELENTEAAASATEERKK